MFGRFAREQLPEMDDGTHSHYDAVPVARVAWKLKGTACDFMQLIQVVCFQQERRHNTTVVHQGSATCRG